MILPHKAQTPASGHCICQRIIWYKTLDKPGPEIYNQYMTNVRGTLIKSVSPMNLKWNFTNCSHTPPKDSISLEFHFRIVMQIRAFPIDS